MKMLSPEKNLQAVLMDRVLCQRSLKYFAKRAWPILEPSEFQDGWHIDAICEHLEAVVYGNIRKLVINMPPRHMKSILCSVLFPAWAWTIKPQLRWLFASYAKSLSIRDSVKCRRVIQSDWYQTRFGAVYQLTSDQNAKEKYENSSTGHRIATSVDGAGTGEGGDILVFDDPHKVGEAESDNVRKGVIDWHDGEMSSRGNDPKTVAEIIVMQRVHEEDLSGHVLSQNNGYEHLCLPARFEPERRNLTVIGWTDPRNEPGELLWPKRFGDKELTSLEKSLGHRSAGQLQQRPAPAEGFLFKRADWKYWDILPGDIDMWAISVDLPFEEGPTNSYAVMQLWAKKGANRYLVDQSRGQIGFTAQIAMLEALIAKWTLGPTGIYIGAKWIEKKANGAAMLDVLKDKIPGMNPINPRGSKFMRAQAVHPEVLAGNVYLPNPATTIWVNDFVNELATFPNGANDQVDAFSQALMKLANGIVDEFDLAAGSLTGESKWINQNAGLTIKEGR